ncbi:MAG TPA: nucleoside recognition domain-containing protein [Clostridiales bacterium]|nr:nucleoside recognition domain-containing protein [Clostridiales bacterium]
MLNYIWFAMLVFGFIIGIMNGRIAEVTNAVIESSGDAIKLSINLLGIICLWSGLMKIAEKSGLVRNLASLVRPLIHFLFPDVPKNHPAAWTIIMNMSANILGLGNAATPLGLKAMEELQKLNPAKHSVSNDISMFLVLNTASLQLIPTSVIAIRAQAGSANPAEIISSVWIASVCAATCGVISVKLLSRIWGKGRKVKKARKGAGR